jgi:hypothetical protein
VLLFSLEKGVKDLQDFGDLIIVINSETKSQQCHNLQLLSLLEEVHSIMETDDLISVWHVYREINREAYSLSKTGLRLAKG